MAVNQSAIDRLRLDEAFSDNVYRPFNECWTIRMNSVLVVIDDDTNNISRFSDDVDERPKALIVLNNNNRQIVLLSIDNKLIKNHVGGIADCALLDEEHFHIIEFKTNALGHSEQSIRDTFEKAIKQINETIHLFHSRLNAVDICFENAISLSCQIVLSDSFPRSKAIKQDYQVQFADEHNGIGLLFSQKLNWG